MFAIITPALISVAIVGRIKFKSYISFVALWGLIVYAPVCHWVWAAGKLKKGWGVGKSSILTAEFAEVRREG